MIKRLLCYTGLLFINVVASFTAAIAVAVFLFNDGAVLAAIPVLFV